MALYIYNRCTDHWRCTYIPLIVIYSVGVVVAFLWLLGRDLSSGSTKSSKKDGPKNNSSSNEPSNEPTNESSTTQDSTRGISWPPQAIRRDVCLWPLYPIMLLIPALLWPAVAGLGATIALTVLISIFLKDIGKGIKNKFSAESCCGIPLRRRRRGASGEDLETGRLSPRDRHSVACDMSVVSEPPPAYAPAARLK